MNNKKLEFGIAATSLSLLLLLPTIQCNAFAADTAATDKKPAEASSSSSPSSPQVTPAGSQQQAVPEWLKDYDSQIKDQYSKKPLDGAAKTKDGATTDSEPPPPLTPVAPAAKPIVTPVAKPVESSASARKPIVLQGRLEEIGGSGAKLPVGILNGSLKAETPKMDPKGVKLQSGLVASFPMDWRGAWGGQLKIHWTQIDKIAWEFDPEETAEVQKVLTPGIEGTVSFNFEQSGKNITLEPASIIFPPRQNESRARELQAQLKNSPFAGMFGGQGSAFVQALSQGSPVLVLGGLNGTGITGNQLNSHVLKNDIRELKPGVLEQNIVVREADKNKNTGKTQHTFSETVLRFTKLNQNQLYVQAASIKYRQDGHFESKVLLYGTVNRGQGSQYPTGLPGMMPGGLPSGMPAMPGLPAGGDGGFGELNKMLKQLQGY